MGNAVFIGIVSLVRHWSKRYLTSRPCINVSPSPCAEPLRLFINSQKLTFGVASCFQSTGSRVRSSACAQKPLRCFCLHLGGGPDAASISDGRTRVRDCSTVQYTRMLGPDRSNFSASLRRMRLHNSFGPCWFNRPKPFIHEVFTTSIFISSCRTASPSAKYRHRSVGVLYNMQSVVQL